MKALIFTDQFASYSWMFLYSLYFENVLQEFACAGVGGGSKMVVLGRTYFMDGPIWRRGYFLSNTKTISTLEVVSQSKGLCLNRLLKKCQKSSKNGQNRDFEPRFQAYQSTYRQTFDICWKKLIRPCYHVNFMKNFIKTV